MGINFLQTSLSDLSKEKTLRFDVKFHNVFTKVIETKETRPFLDFFEPAEKKCDEYELNEIKYVEIGSATSEGEINPFDLFNKELDITEKERLTKKIENGDIFKPEKGSLLIASVRPNLKKFLPITDEEKNFYFTKAFIYLRPKQNLIENRLLKYLLRTVLFERLVGLCREGKGYPTLKEDDLKFFFIDNELIKKIEQNKENLFRKIDENEQAIFQIKPKIESLQDIIDDVFVKYELKSTNEKRFELENTLIDFSEISNNFYLRNSSLYHIFWVKYEGALLEQDKFGEIRLRDLIIPNVHRVKKGLLECPMILLNFEDIESFTGRILNLNQVEEIGSDKNVLSGNDIVISKMNNHLGYTFTLSQLSEQKDMIIGSSEFIPYLIKDKTRILPAFIKYLLLTKDFLNISKFLRSGKSQSHPRIHIKDLLAIKIPLPDLQIQQKIVSEIQEREEKSNQYREKIKKLREEIDNLIYQQLK